MESNEIISVSRPMDTICAVSTPPGIGGIAVIRVSGPQAIEISSAIWQGKNLCNVNSHTAHLGIVLAKDGSKLDNVVATVFRSPKSFTGEDVVELSVHGSGYIQKELLLSLINSGARLAEPGEFSRRAFMSGRIDLAQAEGIADMIASTSAANHRIAFRQMSGGYSEKIKSLASRLLKFASLIELELDFSEEDVEFASRKELLNLGQEIASYIRSLTDSFSTGTAIKEGIPVAIVGSPNSGKSTLLNALVEDDLAIVSDIRGTTRDTIEGKTVINGQLFRFIDTAGLRATNDPIEEIGISKALSRVSRAAIVLWLIEPGSSAQELRAVWDSISDNLNSDAHLIIVMNKRDTPTFSSQLHDVVTELNLPHTISIIAHSSFYESDIASLKELLSTHSPQTNGETIVTNIRHYQALMQASSSMSRAIQAIETGIPADLVAQDIRETLHHLSTITGEITTPAILSNIFAHFCIGK